MARWALASSSVRNCSLFQHWPDGSYVKHHPLPDGHVTNIAFGGADMRTAFVTMAGSGKLVALDWHEPGLVLAYNA